MIVDFPDGVVPGLPTSLMRQANGKIVITGHRRTGVGATVAVVRTMSDGALDADLRYRWRCGCPRGGHPFRAWSRDGQLREAFRRVLQADGRIVVAEIHHRIEPDPWGGSASEWLILRLERNPWTPPFARGASSPGPRPASRPSRLNQIEKSSSPSATTATWG